MYRLLAQKERSSFSSNNCQIIDHTTPTDLMDWKSRRWKWKKLEAVLHLVVRSKNLKKNAKLSGVMAKMNKMANSGSRFTNDYTTNLLKILWNICQKLCF